MRNEIIELQEKINKLKVKYEKIVEALSTDNISDLESADTIGKQQNDCVFDNFADIKTE
jgi:hypothetical protein